MKEQYLYIVAIATGLAVGLAIPLLMPKQVQARIVDVGALLDHDRRLIGALLLLAILASVGVMYGFVLLASRQPRFVRIGVKVLAIGEFSLGTGYVFAIALAFLFQVGSREFFLFFGIGAVLYLSAGLSGLLAIRSIPHYL